jgi:septum formation protein
MTVQHILLASSSPRRKTLLEEAGYRVTVIPPDVEEVWRRGETPSAYAQRNAEEKAAGVWSRGHVRIQAGEVLLAADTIVVLDNEILEKPSDHAHAVAMLERLSGKSHVVLTGVCLAYSDRRKKIETRAFVETTKVIFKNINASEILAYVNTGESMDKAGAYAIQGGAAGMVERIEGSYSNVIGLPMERVTREIQNLVTS